MVIGTDKGLCGGLNSNLFREVVKIENSAKFISVGKRASQFLSKTRRDLLADFTVPDKPTFADVRKIVEFLAS